MVSAEWWNEPTGPPPPDTGEPETSGFSADGESQKPQADSYEATHEELMAQYESWRHIPAPPEAMYYGPLGEIALEEGAHTESDPKAIYTGLKCCFGNSVGMTPRFGDGHLSAIPINFMFLVGESAVTRKSSTLDLIVYTVNQIDPSWRQCVHYSASSGEWILNLIRDGRVEEVLDKKTNKLALVQVDPGVTDKRAVICCREFADLFSKQQRQGNVLFQMIRDAFDGGPVECGAKSNRDRCERPRLTVIGATTHTDIKYHMPKGFLKDGTANRFWWVLATEMPARPYASINPKRLCPRQIEQLARVSKQIRTAPVWEMHWSPEAWELLNTDLYYQARAYRKYSVTSRADTHLHRGAMDLALADGKHQIEVPHLEAEWLAWKHVYAPSVIAIHSLELTSENAQRILEYLREKGTRGATRTEIRNKVFKGHMAPQDLTLALDELLKANLARKEGSKPERWFAVESSNGNGNGSAPQVESSDRAFGPNAQNAQGEFESAAPAEISPESKVFNPKCANAQGELARSSGSEIQPAHSAHFSVVVGSSSRVKSNLSFHGIRDLCTLTFCQLVSANSTKNRIAIDIETAAVFDISDARYLRTAEPRLVSLCMPDAVTGCNAESADTNPPATFLVDFPTLSADEKSKLRDMLEGCDLVVFNGFFDLAILERCLGPFTQAPHVFDCMLAAAILDNYAKPTGLNEARGYPSLASVLRDYLDVELSKEEQASDWSASELRPEQLAYAAADVAHLHQLRARLEARLETDGLRATFNLETALAPVTRSIIAGGTGADLDLAKSLYAERLPRARELYRRAQAELGIKNPISHTQLLTVLQRRDVQVPLRRNGVTTQVLIEDTRKRTLLKIKTEPGVQTVLELRALTKELEHCKSWLDAYTEDGRVFPEYFQIGTVTGRYSNKRVTLQQLKKSPIRAVLVSDPGCVLVDFDFKLIEVVGAAIIYQEPALEAIIRSGVDIYKKVASLLLGCSVEDIAADDDPRRKFGKITVLSLNYCKGPDTFIEDCWLEGVQLSDEEIRAAYDKYFEQFPRIRAYQEAQFARAIDLAEARSLSGRRSIMARGHERWQLRNKLTNHPVQMACSDTLKGTMVGLYALLPPGARILGSCHDEVFMSVPPAAVRYVCQKAQEIAAEVGRNILQSDIPVRIDITTGANWWECTKAEPVVLEDLEN
jgi:DNA polymerase-1